MGLSKLEARARRKKRIRKNLQGCSERPRLCVFRSLKYTYAQLISDEAGKVIASATTAALKSEGAGEEVPSKSPSKRSIDSAKALGIEIAKVAQQHNIKTVVFDRNGYKFHGRVAAVAQGAREGGLQF